MIQQPPRASRLLFSRMMEVFAGFLSHSDHHLGRWLDFLREQGELDNTIVMVIADNRASAEGGPTGTTNEAVCPWPGPSFAEAGVGFGEPISAARLSQLDSAGWELDHVAEDPAETHNLAADHTDRLIALISTWYAEAGKHGVLPIDGSGLARLIGDKPLIAPPRDQYTIWPNTQPVPFFAGPRVLDRPHSITAFVEIPDCGAEGVLLCQGTAAGGYSLYLKDQRLHYVHNYVGRSLFEVSSPEPVPPGAHELRFEFEPTGNLNYPTERVRPDTCSCTSTETSWPPPMRP